jgi:fused signal recognition particle receptor
MSGFFKKLFNRITGRKDEPAPAPELEKLPAPEPEPVPLPPEPEPEPVAPEPEPVVITAPEEPRRPEPKKPEPKTRTELKKVEAKKPEPKKPEPKKIEVRKPEPPKARAEVKKPELKKPEPKKPEAKKPEPKKLEPKKPEPKAKAKSEPKKRETEKPAPATKKIVEPPPPPPPPPEPEPDPVAEVIPVPEPEVIVETIPVAAEPESPSKVGPPPPVPEPERRGWFARLKDGLSKSSKSITGSITAIFTKRKLDAATLQDLEDVLLQADLGLPMAERILKAVSAGRYDKDIDPEEVKQILASEVAKVLKPVEVPFNFGNEKPFVILVVGVNGAGKTTTIGKLGAIATGEGFKVMFAACDTFRAAAIEQLTIWGQRIGATTISRPTGADSSGLAYDAMTEARNTSTDILFIDTAGRLQNKAYLMDELDKVVRVIKKQDATAPHAVLLVLDATTGQNALAQADIFTKVAGVTGLIMTKLDGTARGGILVAIAEKFKLPVHAVGVGEQIDDLQPFDAEGFARAIAGLEDA